MIKVDYGMLKFTSAICIILLNVKDHFTCPNQDYMKWVFIKYLAQYMIHILAILDLISIFHCLCKLEFICLHISKCNQCNANKLMDCTKFPQNIFSLLIIRYTFMHITMHDKRSAAFNKAVHHGSIFIWTANIDNIEVINFD